MVYRVLEKWQKCVSCGKMTSNNNRFLVLLATNIFLTLSNILEFVWVYVALYKIIFMHNLVVSWIIFRILFQTNKISRLQFSYLSQIYKNTYFLRHISTAGFSNHAYACWSCQSSRHLFILGSSIPQLFVRINQVEISRFKHQCKHERRRNEKYHVQWNKSYKDWKIILRYNQSNSSTFK